jgi:hypothetical protein
MAYSPSAPGIQPLAFPTTQLSLAPPNFTLKSVPTKSAGPKTPAPSNPPKTTNMQSAPSSTKSSTLAPRGQLHVKLIQARGLAVKSALSRPYVVVVYEQNEFVSREPTHEHEKEVKGKPNPLSRQSSSVNVTTTSAAAQKSLAMDALGGIQKAFDIKPRTTGASASNKDGDSTPVKEEKNNSPPENGKEGGQSSSRSSSGSSGGSKDLKLQLPSSSQSMHDATNPVWKHQVSL